MHDYSHFTKRRGNEIVIMLVYVDDLLNTGNSSSLIGELKEMLNNNFKMKGDLKYFIGIEIVHSDMGIILCQRKYALDLLSEVGLLGGKPFKTPMEQNIKLTSKGCDLNFELNKDDALIGDPNMYRKLTRKLLYSLLKILSLLTKLFRR